jgi:beta-galactosidase
MAHTLHFLASPHQRKTSGYGDFTNHSDKNLDMENMLRVTIRGWTDDDTKNLHPDNETLGNNSGQLAGNEVHQHKMARVDGGSVRGRVDKNTVAWLYEDHGADREYENAPLKNVNAKGWVDMYRVPKYIYYLWQANYCSYPMVFIQPHFWRTRYLGQKKVFQVDSNCQEVELFFNDSSKGKKYPEKDSFFTFETDSILVGKGKLVAVGRNKGKDVARWEINMAGKPSKLSLKTEQKKIVADRSGLVIIMADIVDMEGNHVYGATNTLKWEISGDGTLVGPPVYQTDFDKDLADEGCGYIDAPVANLVRATNKAGMITVRVSSPGLEPAEIKIQTIKPIPAGSEKLIKQPELLDKGRDMVVKRATVSQGKVEVVEEIKPIPAGKDVLEGKS